MYIEYNKMLKDNILLVDRLLSQNNSLSLCYGLPYFNDLLGSLIIL